MGCGEERGAGVAGDNFGNGERAKGGFADATESREKFGEAVFALGVADVEDRRLHGGMPDEDAGQLETGVAGYADDGEL